MGASALSATAHPRSFAQAAKDLSEVWGSTRGQRAVASLLHRTSSVAAQVTWGRLGDGLSTLHVAALARALVGVRLMVADEVGAISLRSSGLASSFCASLPVPRLGAYEVGVVPTDPSCGDDAEGRSASVALDRDGRAVPSEVLLLVAAVHQLLAMTVVAGGEVRSVGASVIR